MNYVLQFLNDNSQRLNLASYGLEGGMTTVVLTPRFRASSHVVFLILAKGRPEPVLVAKTPRLQECCTSLEREARNLQSVQGLRPGGFPSFPRVVAFEEYQGRPILIETALVGRPMDPGQMRRSFDSCCAAALECLADLHRCQINSSDSLASCYDQSVAGELQYLADSVPWNAEERNDLAQTRELVEPLQALKTPTVLEHGDFSHPNLMLLRNGRVGVVDWEMANLRGFPTYDLIFFLTYAAFAKHGARENGNYIPAIHDAFFGSDAWGRRLLVEYARQLQIPLQALTPLYILCWVRYMAGLLRRLDESGSRFSAETADWLRQNRYYAGWRYSLSQLGQLRWEEAGK